MGSLAQDGQLSRTVTVLFPPSGAIHPELGASPFPSPGSRVPWGPLLPSQDTSVVRSDRGVAADAGEHPEL